MKVTEEEEARDEAIRIAKVWGCLCRPTMVQTYVKGMVRYTTLRHHPTCPYRPKSFFEPKVEIDQEEVDRRAKLMKRRRTTLTARANKAAKARKAT